MKVLKKIGLPGWIFIAMILGIIAGLLSVNSPEWTNSVLKPLGNIFINLLKFIVVPVVLLSIMGGMISMKDIRKVGSIGWKTIVYYLCTTAIAVVIGLIVANLFKGSFPMLSTVDATYEASSASFIDVIVGIFPSNILAPLVNSNMLQIIVIALFFGAGIIVSGDKGKLAGDIVDSLNEVTMKVMMMVIKISPFGVFCLMANTIAVNGPSIITSLGIVLGVAYIAYILHYAIVYSFSVKVFGKMSPLKFVKGMIPAMILAFTSTSSVATLPLTKQCADDLGADPEYSSFILPLGATINMDGTAIYQGVASIFIACCYGIDLTIGNMLMIILTATLASIGTAGVSGAGMIMLAMVLESVGLPVEGIGLIYGVDKLFDMGRTTLNIVGDASCAICVTQWEANKMAKKAAKAAKA